MKKLIKSAKQRFDERLNELCDVQQHHIHDDMFLYTATEGGNFVMLFNNGKNYYQAIHDMPLLDVVLSNEFLVRMAEGFLEEGKDLKPLFDWYVMCTTAFSVDNAPFDWLDFWNLDLGELYDFPDIYEEVPDVITAKEQWEKDSQNAVQVLNCMKIEETNDNIIIYTDDHDKYYRFEYPSLNFMRKDKDFVFAMLKVINEEYGKEDVTNFMDWVQCGGDFPFPLSILQRMEFYENSSCTIYTDKPVKSVIEDMVNLTPEQKDAVKMIEEGVKLLRNNGGKLVCYSWVGEWFVVNGNNLTYESTNEEKELERLKSNEFVDISGIADNQQISLDFDIYWATDGMLLARKNNNDINNEL